MREAARAANDAGQARRLLAIAAVYDGMSRASAARLGGMERQTLRDWVHRFNAAGPSGLTDRKAPGAAPRLSAAQKAELAALVEAGPQPEADGVVRWRCIDLCEARSQGRRRLPRGPLLDVGRMLVDADRRGVDHLQVPVVAG